MIDNVSENRPLNSENSSPANNCCNESKDLAKKIDTLSSRISSYTKVFATIWVHLKPHEVCTNSEGIKSLKKLAIDIQDKTLEGIKEVVGEHVQPFFSHIMKSLRN